MTGATLFSGILSPELAMPDVDWRWCAEVDPFCCSLIEERSAIPNLGDVTAADFIARARDYGPIDLLVAGSPCQAFSVAGLRGSLSDDRGNLTLRFVEVVNAIGPRFVLWENVDGVLSTHDNAFGCLLAGLVGADAALVAPRAIDRYREGKKGEYFAWTDAGVVAGPVRDAAWRVLDAQYFRLAQRRRRVFVLAGRSGERPHPAEVLFEPESVRWDTPPRREAGEGVAPTISARTKGGGRLGTRDAECDGALIASLTSFGKYDEKSLPTLRASGGDAQFGSESLIAYGGNNTSGPVDVATACNARERMDFESETMVVTPILEAGKRCGTKADERDGLGIGKPGDPMFTLQSGAQHAVAFSFDTTQITSKTNRSRPKAGDPCHTLAGAAHPPAVAHSLRADGFDASEDGTGGGTPPVAVNLRGREGGAMPELDDKASIRSASGGGSSRSYVATPYAVRRLTPTECERLQGLPDGWTAITHRNKPAADGPRYKAIGNGMAVNVIRWIGERLMS